MLSQKEMTKCEIINRIMELVPDYPKSKLWDMFRDRLIKILRRLEKEKEIKKCN